MTHDQKLAKSLQGEIVRFNHEPECASTHLVIGHNDDGTVEIDSFPGRFAPDLFTIIKPPGPPDPPPGGPMFPRRQG